ncbi:hypothetical protein RFI_31284 [Reticulomyxa filosa]|uniref:NADH dehydrogenase [ubiquinone] 1 alpha subcomplex subunit 12 n=1 Tax=Reticulomyxa filosa TaxID=46433 RepID=X6LXL3_RETFI|nr:hypothetical protein RFI_31284 [Reticulomyxa filosa]|eukprot:ETO06111.1 hypothetical protein RFI_31284 [Reticulomyxa filosa]
MALYKDGQYGSDSVPFLWFQWLRYQRDFPPTEEELTEYDEYLRTIKKKGEEWAEKDRLERETNKDFYQSQRKAEDEVQKRINQRLHQEVIGLFAAREKAIRIAAENKVKKMKEHQQAMEKFELSQQKQELESEWESPKKESEKPVEQQYQPHAWRPNVQSEKSDEDVKDEEIFTPPPKR